MTEPTKSKPVFAVKIDGKEYEIDKLTLGDLDYLGRKAGVEEMIDVFRKMGNPRVWVALTIVAYHRSHPSISRLEAEEAVEAIDLTKIEKREADEVPEPEETPDDPTPAATGGENGETPADESGSSQTTPASSGEPS